MKGIFRSCAVLPALAATFSIMLAGSPTLLAQSGVPKINAQCLPSLGNGNICTANDLNVRSIAIAGPDACTEGELIDVTFEFEISKSANFLSARAADERNTIGFFIGELGEPVIEGNSCTFSSLVPLAPPLNLSGGSGGYRNINGDVCGDILADDVTVHNVSTDQVLCKDGDGDGKLDLDFAVTWETNKNRTCSSATDETEFIPSTSSKCLLNPQFDYDIDVERPPALELVKTAIPDRLPAPGGPVLYRVLIVNDSDPTDPIVISSLEDDIYGDLDGKGDCSVPQTIAPGAAYSCEFTEQVTGNAGAVIRDEIVAMGTDDEGEPVSGSDTADVFIRAGSVVPPDIDVQKFADPVELFEPGGDVSYSVLVQNTGASSVVLNSLTDDRYPGNDLDGAGDCRLPQTLAVGAQYACDFILPVSGNPGQVIVNTVTATASAGDALLQDTDLADVTITDRESRILVIKSPSPCCVSEPGGDVDYTVRVVNLSLADTVTINVLSDNLYGDLNGQGDCAVPFDLKPGNIYRCIFTASVSGRGGQNVPDTVTAEGIDDDGNSVSASGGAQVYIDDVPASFSVAKSANPSTIPEPGGNVTYSITVTNTSATDTINLVGLSDDQYPGNDLIAGTSCAQVAIAPGANYQCSYDLVVSGSAGDVITNTVTASGTDDDFNVLPIATASADVAIYTGAVPPPSILVEKIANPTQLPEPGGTVEYQLTVQNTGADTVKATSIIDVPYGNLNGIGTCVTPTPDILPGATYRCAFQQVVSGVPGESIPDVITVTAENAGGTTTSDSDDAVVTITDLPGSIAVIKTASPNSLPEPGGAVTFEVDVFNSSQVDEITLQSLVDDIHGDLNGRDTCAVPQTIAVDGVYVCSFTADVSGFDGAQETDTVTATGVDDDGLAVSGQASATVTFTANPATIKVTKRARPLIIAPGNPVTFSVTVTNTSTQQSLDVQALSDDDFGNLNGQGDCVIPQQLAPGETYNCAFEGLVDGPSPGIHKNTVTATATATGNLSKSITFISDQDSAFVLLFAAAGPEGVKPVPALPASMLALLILLASLMGIRRFRQ